MLLAWHCLSPKRQKRIDRTSVVAENKPCVVCIETQDQKMSQYCDVGAPLDRLQKQPFRASSNICCHKTHP